MCAFPNCLAFLLCDIGGECEEDGIDSVSSPKQLESEETSARVGASVERSRLPKPMYGPK
jgi:hypothetical protein